VCDRKKEKKHYPAGVERRLHRDREYPIETKCDKKKNISLPVTFWGAWALNSMNETNIMAPLSPASRGGVKPQDALTGEEREEDRRVENILDVIESLDAWDARRAWEVENL
jgi:hypothetical protein